MTGSALEDKRSAIGYGSSLWEQSLAITVVTNLDRI